MSNQDKRESFRKLASPKKSPSKKDSSPSKKLGHKSPLKNKAKDNKVVIPVRKIIVICGNFTGEMYGAGATGIVNNHIDFLILKKVHEKIPTGSDKHEICELSISPTMRKYLEISTENFDQKYVMYRNEKSCQASEIESLINFCISDKNSDRRIFTLNIVNPSKLYSCLTRSTREDKNRPDFRQALAEYVYKNAKNKLGQSLTHGDCNKIDFDNPENFLRLFEPVNKITGYLAGKRDTVIQAIRPKWIKINIKNYNRIMVIQKAVKTYSDGVLYLMLNDSKKEITALPPNIKYPGKEYEDVKNYIQQSSSSLLTPILRINDPVKVQNIICLLFPENSLTEKIRFFLIKRANDLFRKMVSDSLSNLQIFQMRFLVIWVRRSGKQRGGAHIELDMGDNATRQLIDLAKKNDMNVILAGETSNVTEEQGYKIQEIEDRKKKNDLLSKHEMVVWDLREIWKDEEFIDISDKCDLNRRLLQINIFDFLNRITLGIFHIGTRSGSLEPYAYIGQCTHYIEDEGNEQAARAKPFHSPKLDYSPRDKTKFPIKSEGNKPSENITAGSLKAKQSAKLPYNKIEIKYPQTRTGKIVTFRAGSKEETNKEKTEADFPKTSPKKVSVGDITTSHRNMKKQDLDEIALEFPEVKIKGFVKQDLIRLNRFISHTKYMDIRINEHGYSNWEDNTFADFISGPISPTSLQEPMFPEDMTGLIGKYNYPLKEDKPKPSETSLTQPSPVPETPLIDKEDSQVASHTFKSRVNYLTIPHSTPDILSRREIPLTPTGIPGSLSFNALSSEDQSKRCDELEDFSSKLPLSSALKIRGIGTFSSSTTTVSTTVTSPTLSLTLDWPKKAQEVNKIINNLYCEQRKISDQEYIIYKKALHKCTTDNQLLTLINELNVKFLSTTCKIQPY